MPNACPPKYRHLSPQDECYLRSVRLDASERPGGLPSIHITLSANSIAHHRQRVLDRLRVCPCHTRTLSVMLGRTDGTLLPILGDLQAEGLITGTKAGRAMSWALVELVQP